MARTCGGDGGGGNMEARITKLEADVGHIQTDVADIKADLRQLSKDARNDVRWLLGTMGAGFVLLLVAMAGGFGWF